MGQLDVFRKRKLALFEYIGVIIIFDKFRAFWALFWNSLRGAYNKTYKAPCDFPVQQWRDTSGINFLDIFVTKLNNLTNCEATFAIESDSTQTATLKELCKELEAKRFDITAAMLADGDYYCFPSTDANGAVKHSYLTQQQVRILNMNGDEITEAYGIIDWYVDKNSKVYYLLRHHKLDGNGTLQISYSTVNGSGAVDFLDRWADISGQAYAFSGAKHIGFGRYKSPTSDRGLSPIYGVPLNFGCSAIEEAIQSDLKLIENEFKNGESRIFTDPRNLIPDDKRTGYKIAGNIIPIQHRAGDNGPNIDIFNPNLRFSEHYARLVNDMSLYEKQIGTSKGILTDNETAYTATATAVKRANADTLALLDKIRNAIDEGNRMTLTADSIYLNVRTELWKYSADWYDPFEDPSEQWQRLVEAKTNGAAEVSDLIRWQFPKLTQEEIDGKITRINESTAVSEESALERILYGR